MKAIMVMFDTLRLSELPNYGNPFLHAPNFQRLGEQTVKFDNFYAGSLPCMPARRELHTGRYNFLHRSWGPLEPFDISAMEILKEQGIYTHMVTDHHHYLEDGGATYHGRYSSWEVFRGQEGDRWKGVLGEIPIPNQAPEIVQGLSFRHNHVNRMFQQDEENQSIAQVFEAGSEFIQMNHQEDNWFLQIEAFDPHEPFFSPQKYKDLYPDDYSGGQYDYLAPHAKVEDEETSEHIHNEYKALVSMCDHYLGKVLDLMDEHDMWKDTMLIVNTDHGLMMGENDWWGKMVQPFYNEIAHLPFFIWDPRFQKVNESCDILAQTIDIPATLLDYFNVEIPETMAGKPLRHAYEEHQKLRDYALFGTYGVHVNITDGKEVYMRASTNASNQPLFEYTLLPTHLRGFFAKKQFAAAEMTTIPYTDGYAVMKLPGGGFFSPFYYGHMLYDLTNDPGQHIPIDNMEKEQLWKERLTHSLQEALAPDHEFVRLGLDKEIPLHAERQAYREALTIAGITEHIDDIYLRRAIMFGAGFIFHPTDKDAYYQAIRNDKNFTAQKLYDLVDKYTDGKIERMQNLWAFVRNIYELENIF